MIASALAEVAELYLEEGKALPMPSEPEAGVEADLIERIPLVIEVPAAQR